MSGKPEQAGSPEFDAAFRERLIDLIAWRRDVRRFRTDPVDTGLIAELMQAANLAPSVGNSQPWRWVRVKDAGRRARVIASFETENSAAAEIYEGHQRSDYISLKLAGLREAPEHFAIYCDESTQQGSRLGRLTMQEMLRYSTVCSVHTFWLAARARGVGVGWVSILDPQAVSAALDVPDDWRLVAYLCVGWPEEEHDDPELARAGWQTRVPITVYTR